MLSGPKGPLELTGKALTAFERIKNSLADATLLTHPAPETQLSLMVDASTVAVGAVLQQHFTGSTPPLSFFSKRLLPAETRYSTFGRELLAIYLALKHFRHSLEGRDFTVFTDHKPLTFALRSHTDKLNPREIRQLGYISRFTSDIRHIDGSRNEVADTLSRPSIAHLQLSPGIDLAEMAAEQRRVGPPCDEDVSGLQLRKLPLTTGNGTILCDVSTPSHRPFVPPSLRRKVFSSLHPGSRAIDKLVSDRFAWPGMHKDLKAWTRACIACQRSKIQRHNTAPIGTFPGPGARFSHVHLDIVGPLPLSNGCSYLLTCVDRFTRWPEAIPLPDIAAPTVVKAFLSRWVAIFGAPSTITTDRGAQFESYLFQSLLSFLGCTRIRTTAYNPAANGMVERFHRQLKASLRAAADPENWTDHLPLVLLGIRSALKPDLDCSAAELVFGSTVRLPGEMISPTPQGAVEDPTNLLHRLRQFMRTLSPVPPRSSASPSYLEKDLATCSHVYLRCGRVRRPLEPLYDGPFRVISRGTKNFRIQRGTREEVVSVDRLKAAVPDTPPDEPCCPLHPAPSPRPSIPPSRILPLPSCPQPPTATTPSSTNNTYEALIDTFKEAHKRHETLKSDGLCTAEIKRDITAMQEEKEQILRRISRMKKKLEMFPTSTVMLDMAKKLRLEREREAKVVRQMQEQRSLIQNLEQRLVEIRQQMTELRRRATECTSEALINRLQEEVKVNQYLATDKQPKEIEVTKLYVDDLTKVASQPAMTQNFLDQLNQKLREVHSETNRLIEKRMVAADPLEDKVSLFRQQANIAANRKESTASALAEAREKLVTAQQQLETARAKLAKVVDESRNETTDDSFTPVSIPKAEDFQRYVTELRNKNLAYKQKRGILSHLKAEKGILSRTVDVLKTTEKQCKRQLDAVEAAQGVSGYWETMNKLEKVSERAVTLNQRKGSTLEEMSALVGCLTQHIMARRDNLAPLIRELRPLRTTAQEIAQKHAEKKAAYDSFVASRDSQTLRLEQEVRVLREETRVEESRYHYLNAALRMLRVQQFRLQEEMRGYLTTGAGTGDGTNAGFCNSSNAISGAGGGPGKRRSYRDIYLRKISDLESQMATLREQQKHLNENEAANLRQVKIWRDLITILQNKIAIRKSEEEKIASGGEYADVQKMEKDRLLL
nr:unnamed protein product [Spirometra erinaceieuropaei]